MPDNAFVAFWSGMMAGAVIGIFIFAIILAIRAGKREEESS